MWSGDMYPVPHIHIDPQDPCVMLFSSGTTGMPKGTLLTHYAEVANVLQQGCEEFGFGTGYPDVFVAFLPYFHIYAVCIFGFFNLYYGYKTVVMERFDFESYLKIVEKYKATVLHLVPPVALMLAKHPSVDNYDLTSVRTIFIGAAPLTQQLSEEVAKRIKVHSFQQAYGLTETAPVATATPLKQYKHGSAGIIVPNTQFKVVDIESGKNLGVNEEGEFFIRGPQIMKGYFNNSKATADTIDADGWLRTGDIGHFDEDGFIFVSDRLKEMIKYKGYQVAPAELEGLLIGHPDIKDAAVIGIPDEAAGELPKAFIVKQPGAHVTEKDVVQFLSEHVATYKRLRGGVEFVPEIPKSPSGKILRRILRKRAPGSVKSKL